MYNNHDLSGQKEVTSVGCKNMPGSSFHNILYRLSSAGLSFTSRFADATRIMRQECSKLYQEDISNYGSDQVMATLAQSLPPCPCSVKQAQLDGLWRAAVISDRLNCYDYKFSNSNNATQRCCYSTK